MLAERRRTTELMDDPHLPAATYRQVLADLASVNRLTMAYRPTLSFLGRVARKRRQLSVLDVGFGHGDTLRRIAEWARARNIAVKLVGIDLNPGSESVARSATPADLAIDYRTGDYTGLSGERFDCIISSLVAHHMEDDELVAFLRFMEQEAQAGWLVNDLHRHQLSYHGYPLLARVMGWHEIVRKDGQTSIARAFRSPEWRQLLQQAGIASASVRRYFPFRLCVERIH